MAQDADHTSTVSAVDRSRLEKSLTSLRNEIERCRLALFLIDSATVTDALSLAAKQFQDDLGRCGFGTEIERRAETTRTLSGRGSAYAEVVKSLSGAGLSEYEPFFYFKSGITTLSGPDECLERLRSVVLLMQREGWTREATAAFARWQHELEFVAEQSEKLHERGSGWLQHVIKAGETPARVSLAFAISEPALTEMENAAVNITQSAFASSSLNSAADDSAFVAAKSLYQHRGMTPAKCNKFLVRFGSESTERVEGKIRNRRRGKNRRDIHAGDWHKFWECVDRRQFEFIQEDAIQGFLAIVEAEKERAKSKGKYSQPNSRQVSDLAKKLR